jgi:hypothetical protein
MFAPEPVCSVEFQACRGNMYKLSLQPLLIHVLVTVRLFCIRAGCSGQVGIPWEYVCDIVAAVADSCKLTLPVGICTCYCCGRCRFAKFWLLTPHSDSHTYLTHFLLNRYETSYMSSCSLHE